MQLLDFFLAILVLQVIAFVGFGVCVFEAWACRTAWALLKGWRQRRKVDRA